MIALSLTGIRDCMSKLLLSDTFDSFFFIEGEVTTFITFSLDGYLKKEFYREKSASFGNAASSGEAAPPTENKIPGDDLPLRDSKILRDGLSSRDYALWGEVRKYCHFIIRGKRTPLNFRLVLGLPARQIERLILRRELPIAPEDVRGLYLNLRYDRHTLQCMTGTAMNHFTMDKSLEQAWDQAVQGFFVKKEIAFELL